MKQISRSPSKEGEVCLSVAITLPSGTSGIHGEGGRMQKPCHGVCGRNPRPRCSEHAPFIHSCTHVLIPSFDTATKSYLHLCLYPYLWHHYSEQPKGGNNPGCLSTGEWINKMWPIHTMEYYSALKKEILVFGKLAEE